MPKAVGDEDPEELLGKLIDADQYIERLKEINVDTRIAFKS